MNNSEKALLEAKANVLKAIAHPTRLWIVEKLSAGECCVCEFVKSTEFDFSTISKHLSVLKNAGVVESEKRGKKVFYKLNVPCILKFMTCVETVVKSDAEKRLAAIS